MSPDELPKGWHVLPLSHLAAREPNAITDGPFGSKLKTSHYTASGPRVVRLQNIGEGKFVDEKAHISEEHFTALQKHRVCPGDLVIAALGDTLPRACLIPESLGPAIVKADCIRFKADSGQVSARYLMYALLSPQVRHQADAIIHGVGRPRLNQGEIKSLQIPCAPRPVQDEIVSEIDKQFTRLDAGVESLKRLQAHLRRYRTAVLSESFEPTREGVALRSLGTVAEVRLGKMLSAKARAPGMPMLPYLRNENVRWGRIDTTSVKEMGFTPEEQKRFRVEPGDLMVCEGGEPGRAAVYEGPAGRFMYQKALHRVRPKPEALSPQYLRYFLEHNAARLRTSQTTIAHFPLEKMLALEVPTPPLSVQVQAVAMIQERLSQGEAVADQVAANLHRAHRLRAAVLRAAIGGTLTSRPVVE